MFVEAQPEEKPHFHKHFLFTQVPICLCYIYMDTQTVERDLGIVCEY